VLLVLCSSAERSMTLNLSRCAALLSRWQSGCLVVARRSSSYNLPA
jgi:hypothetical protein